MSELREVIAKTVSSEGGSVSVKPNGKTKQILGRNTTGYDIAISLPVTVGGPGGMAMTLNMTGETYVAKGAPGTQDYIAFYKAASEKGFIFGDPKAAKGAPGPSKAMADMFKEFSKMGGVPYESNMQMKGGGEGMASIMAKMFNISSTSLVTASIGDDMFAPPAGYKLKPVSVK
jgi:hypothetical protein